MFGGDSASVEHRSAGEVLAAVLREPECILEPLRAPRSGAARGRVFRDWLAAIGCVRGVLGRGKVTS